MTLTPDNVEVIEEGDAVTVVVQRVRTGRPSSSEAAKPIYALYHAAAESEYPGAIPRVEVAYLATETIEVIRAKPPAMRSKAAQYDAAIVGILSGDFPAKSDDFVCPRCAHYFICPHAEDM